MQKTFDTSLSPLLDQTLTQALTHALEASALAHSIISQAYEQHNFAVIIKADSTPVTEVDIATEKAIRHHLETHFPEHGIFGEEEGRSDKDSDFLWLIDPIDGTKAFIRRRPFFSCQIALMYQGEIVLGVSTAPSFNGGEQFYALKGRGAYRRVGLEGPAFKPEDERLEVSEVATLSKVVLSSGNLKTLTQDSNQWKNYGTLLAGVNSTRGFGDFLHYHLLAQGSLDLIVESDVNILDIAALSIIVKEAGGVVTTLEGEPLSLAVESILAGPPLIHKIALDLLSGR